MAQIFREILFQEPNSIFIKVMIMINLIFSAILGYSEGSGKQNLEYSKFWNLKSQEKIKIPSKIGMIIAYTPSLITCLSFFWIFPNGGIRFFMLNFAITIHFFKRLLEVINHLTLFFSSLSICIDTMKKGKIYNYENKIDYILQSNFLDYLVYMKKKFTMKVFSTPC